MGFLGKLGALLRPKPKSPSRRNNNGARQTQSPQRNNVRKGVLNENNNRTLRGLRAIVTAKRGGNRWVTRARRAINNRGRPTVSSPSRRNNVAMKLYVPHQKEWTWTSNRQGGMWN